MDERMMSYRSTPLIEVNGFCIQETVHLEPFEMGAHAHEEAHFCLLLSGEAECTYRQEVSQVGAMTFSYMPPEQEHKTSYRTGVSALYFAVRKSAIERLGLPTTVDLSAPWDRSFGPHVELARRIHSDFRVGDRSSRLLLEELMVELYATMGRVGDFAKPLAPPKWLLRAREMLHEEFGCGLSITEIANEVGIHPVHLMRNFRLYYGSTIGDYARELRVELACRKIETLGAERSLGYIGLELGFSDQQQFSRFFRKYMGITPSEYRKSHRGF